MMLQRNLLYTGVTRGKRLVNPARAEESGGDRRQERLGPAALVEAARMAESRLMVK
jgi:hypothetical protein